MVKYRTKLILACALILLSFSAEAATLNVIGGGVASAPAGDTYSDILFYWDCESATVNYAANGGDTSATAADGGTTSSTQKLAGTNSLYFPNSYARYTLTLNNDDIVDVDAGRVGFWMYCTTMATNFGLWRAYYDANNYIRVMVWDADQLFMEYFSGGSGVQWEDSDASSVAANTGYYIEMRWNKGGAGNDYILYVNGVEKGRIDTATGVWAKSASGTMVLGDHEGNSGVCYIDQVFVTNDPARSLYDIRTCTNCYPH